MKKLLFALSLLGIIAFAAAPDAKADEYYHHHDHDGYYRHHGHPGYRHRYRHCYYRHGRRIYYYTYGPYGYYYPGPVYSPGVSIHIGL